MQLHFEILPAAAGAGLYLAYRFLAVRVHPGTLQKLQQFQASQKIKDVQCDDVITSHDMIVNDLPEPEPEQEREFDVAIVPDRAARPKKAPRHQHARHGLLAVFVVFAIARCVHFKSMIQHRPSQETANISSLVSATANLVVSDQETHAAIDVSSGQQMQPFLSEVAPLLSDVTPDAALYSVKLDRQRMPIYSIGDVVYYRSAYYGTLMVGAPAVPFKVVFDTGSGHLILPSTYCHTETCRVHRRYRRSASTSGQDIDYDGTPV